MTTIADRHADYTPALLKEIEQTTERRRIHYFYYVTTNIRGLNVVDGLESQYYEEQHNTRSGAWLVIVDRQISKVIKLEYYPYVHLAQGRLSELMYALKDRIISSDQRARQFEAVSTVRVKYKSDRRICYEWLKDTGRLGFVGTVNFHGACAMCGEYKHITNGVIGRISGDFCKECREAEEKFVYDLIKEFD